MKNVVVIPLIFILTASFVNYAKGQANRSHGAADRSGRGSQRTGDRMNRTPASQAGNSRMNSIQRSATFRHNDGRADAINNRRVISTNPQRNQIAVAGNGGRGNSYSSTQNVYRQNTVVNVRNVNRNISPAYRNYPYRGNHYYYNRGGYHPRYYAYGPRYTVLPRSFITINFGGYPYYYNSGLFYGSYGGYYQPLFPPVGLSIGVLPFGYSRIFIGANLFYYFNGIYYRHYPEQNKYEVVDAPMGATVSALPKGAKSVILNSERLYELNGTYYKEDRDSRGATVYTVVGKNGEVNNSDSALNTPDSGLAPASLNAGDIIDQLPEGSKTVTINGEKLYVTPDDTYLKEEGEGNLIQYKVVGK